LSHWAPSLSVKVKVSIYVWIVNKKGMTQLFLGAGKREAERKKLKAQSSRVKAKEKKPGKQNARN
jgi:hypothetical protein